MRLLSGSDGYSYGLEEVLNFYLQVPKLSKLLPTVVKFALVGLKLLMGYLVSPDVPPLGESLVAYLAREGFLPSMSPLMCLMMARRQ